MSRKPDFWERLSLFITSLGLKPTSFEAEMGFSNGSIGKTLKEKRALGSDRLETIVYKYPTLNTDWLLTGKGTMIRLESSLGTPTAKFSDTAVSTLSGTGGVTVPLVDINVAAGTGYENPEFLETEGYSSFPREWFKYVNAYHLAPRVKGYSMSPTIMDGSRIILSLLGRDLWANLQDNRIYVVVDSESKAHVKRIKNKFDKGFITLMSDNPDKVTYGNFNKTLPEIMYIWYVEFKIDFRMPNIHDQFYSKVQLIEDRYDDLVRRLDTLERKKLSS